MDKYIGLLRDKLDWGKFATFVPNKKIGVYNWLYFKEGYARELVISLLEDWRVNSGVVLDPFCGSGTTLLACKEKSLDSVGLDRLPTALLASIVKTRDWDSEKLRTSATEVFKAKFRPIKIKTRFNKFFNKHVFQDVVFFNEIVNDLPENVKDFFKLGLINSAIKASWVWKDGNVLKVRKHPSAPFRKFYRKRIMKMIKELEIFEGSGMAIVKKRDPWDSGLENESVDAVITSPPYLQQIDYSNVYSIENWIIGENPEMEVYVGIEKMGIYFKDMERVIQELYRVCKPGAKVGIVVGNAYFSREDRIVESDLMLAEIGEKIGFKAKEILVMNKRYALQRRTIKKGIIRESLVILEKPKN